MMFMFSFFQKSPRSARPHLLAQNREVVFSFPRSQSHRIIPIKPQTPKIQEQVREEEQKASPTVLTEDKTGGSQEGKRMVSPPPNRRLCKRKQFARPNQFKSFSTMNSAPLSLTELAARAGSPILVKESSDSLPNFYSTSEKPGKGEKKFKSASTMVPSSSLVSPREKEEPKPLPKSPLIEERPKTVFTWETGEKEEEEKGEEGGKVEGGRGRSNTVAQIAPVKKEKATKARFLFSHISPFFFVCINFLGGFRINLGIGMNNFKKLSKKFIRWRRGNP